MFWILFLLAAAVLVVPAGLIALAAFVAITFTFVRIVTGGR